VILRPAWLLVRLRWRRLLNQSGSGVRWGRSLGPSGGEGSEGREGRPRSGRRLRQATAPRRTPLWPALLFGSMMVIWGFTMSREIIVSIERELGAGTTAAAIGLAGMLLLMVVAALLMSLGTRELSTTEWDLEWLVTLPLPLPALLVVRIIERALINPFAWVLVLPFLWVLAYRNHAGWWTVPLVLAAALPVLLLVGTARTLCDTGLRLHLSPSRLRNLQAVLSILGLVAFYAVLSGGTSSRESFVIRWTASAPAEILHGPTGQAVRAFVAPTPGERALSLGLLVLQSAALFAGVVLLLRYWLREGVVSGGARESGGRGVAAAGAQLVAAGGAPVGSRRLLTPVQARELKLLGRDRNFLVQTMVLPVVIIGAQFFFNTRLLSNLSGEPRHLGAVAFGLSAYVLMFSAFQTLNAEGAALWILWSVPRPLEDVLRQKARLWGMLTLVYPVVLMGGVLAVQGRFTPEAIGVGAIVLLGVPIFATIATCLGVFGSNVLAQDVQRRVRPTFAYLYTLLAAIYTFAIFSSTPWQTVGCVMLTTLVALALWQKARDRLPYLLDPTARPPAQVSLADGLIAALVFFVLQALLQAMQWRALQDAPGRVIVTAFTVAGVITVIALRIVHANTGARGVPRFFGERASRGRAVRWGLAAGAVAAALGLAWILFLRATGLFHDEIAEAVVEGRSLLAWVAVLAVLAAPPFEEFIFRGLVFGGLRRSMRLLPAALASAAIFALVHPPVAVVPVFAMALCAAFAYERAGSLLAPMLTHAVYNLVAVLAQGLLLQ